MFRATHYYYSFSFHKLSFLFCSVRLVYHKRQLHIFPYIYLLIILYKQQTHINQQEELKSRIVNGTKRKTTMLSEFKFARTFIGDSRGSN